MNDVLVLCGLTITKAEFTSHYTLADYKCLLPMLSFKTCTVCKMFVLCLMQTSGNTMVGTTTTSPTAQTTTEGMFCNHDSVSIQGQRADVRWSALGSPPSGMCSEDLSREMLETTYARHSFFDSIVHSPNLYLV